MIWFNGLKVQKGVGLVFVLYKYFGSVRFGFKAKKPNRTETEPGPLLITSHALTIPKRNLLDVRFRLGVCTSDKNIHFKEGNHFPPVWGDNCISWLSNIPFQVFVPHNSPLTTNIVKRARDCIQGSIKANPRLLGITKTSHATLATARDPFFPPHRKLRMRIWI